MSIFEYQTSRFFMPAARFMISRYWRTPARTIFERVASSQPLSRPAISRLAAKRFTSHSHGPGRVSSKSFMSKINRRSADPNTPKFDRWASPQIWTWSPELGVPARSDAMIRAAPR